MMTKVLYVNEQEIAQLVKSRFGFTSVKFDHNEEFLYDEPAGVLVYGLDENENELNDECSFLDLFHLAIQYAEHLGFEFRGWRLFTVYEGFGAALLVRRK